jgi:FkbM family methyltransferase
MSLYTKAGRLLHSLSLRLPQNYAMRSGLRVYAGNRAQNSLFWSVFTSSEYLSFIPHLVRADIRPVIWIDCGAATGYVTLLFNHLIRSNVLPWELEEQVCIEPASKNFSVLTSNLKANKLPASPVFALVGKKNGSETFYENESHPWGSSINLRFSGSDPVNRSYYDLTPILSLNKECILKIDIEGSEFLFLENYHTDLTSVSAIIIEFHKEMGDRAHGDHLLTRAGFYKVCSSLDKNNREVCLYLRQ